ncbi:MAG: hypothetical protein Q8R92_17565 [Deltaproteobacteria bacterium]|nr:hypothetical protein [Deltaproteobacteria bacterium]
MSDAKFDTIPLDPVGSLEEIGIDIADMARTAGGLERRDVIASDKREWHIQTPPAGMPEADLDTLRDHLDGIRWGYGDFWIAAFGSESNTVTARIDRASFRADRVLGFASSRRYRVTLVVIEQ